MVQEAKSRITKKIYNEGWSGGISPKWISLLLNAPPGMCNGIGRYTLLRWAVNQDDDVWLSMRGTRHKQRCGSCGLPGESFPYGYYHPPMCEMCIRNAGINTWSLAPWSRALCVAYTDDVSHDKFKEWTRNWDILPAHDVVCRACGCGDNTIGHWTRWCVVPLIVAIAILQPCNWTSPWISLRVRVPGMPRYALWSLPALGASCDKKVPSSISKRLKQEGAMVDL